MATHRAGVFLLAWTLTTAGLASESGFAWSANHSNDDDVGNRLFDLK